ncbi:MAG: MMPL family transporter [Methylacidiphilales bacterium]|nr:MMPL family transporter [Candidatus Methylacidiphilales bacterium]
MSLIHRILQRLMGVAARLVCAFPGLILTLGILFAALGIWVVVTRFNVVNNTSDLLSDKSPQKQEYNNLVQEFGSDSRFIVFIRSPDQAKNRQAADEIGAYLQSDALKPHIAAVLCKIDYSNLKPRLLFTCSVDELKKIADDIESELNMQQKSEKDSQQIALDLNSILDEANQKFNDKYLRQSKNWKDFTPFVDRFISILNKISAQAEGKSSTQKTDNFSSDASSFDDFDADEMLAQHEYFSMQDGQTVAVFAYPGEEEKDSDTPFSNTVAKIRTQLEQMQKDPKYQGVEMKLTGEPALDADQIASANTDTAKATAITLILIAGLFLFSYRALLRPLFTFLALIMAVLWSLGFALIEVGHFNILSIAVIPMVLGIGIDFGIQILGRYEEELGKHSNINQAVTAALQHTGVAIITGGSTTAAAFFTLCFNDFVGLAELGVIAGMSMVFCILANLLVLPAIFILRDRPRTPEELQAQSSNSAWNFIHSWDKDMVRTPWLWIVLSIIISIISILSLPRLAFDYNLLHLQAPTGPAVQALYELMDASKNDQGEEVSTIYASVVADNIDEARQLKDKLLSLPVVAKIDSILDLVPEHQDEKMPVIQRIVTAANKLKVKPSTGQAVDIPRARRDIASLLTQAQEGLKEARGYMNVSKVAKQAVTDFSKLVPALQRANKALNSAPIATIQQRFDASSTGAFSRMQNNMTLLKTQKADRGLSLADLPPQLQKLFVSPDGKILLQVYGKKDLWERAPDKEFTKAVLAVAPKATGTPILNFYYIDLLRVSYLWASVWAFVAIVVLISFHFQSIKYLLLTLTPLVLAVLWRTGAMVWLNIDFNPANIVTLPLIIGIDVAFGVYIIDRYREDGKLSIFSGSTGKAIIMSSLTSLFGFSSLLVSRFRGMYSIGQLMSLGIAIGLVTAIFILPQILALLKPGPPEGPPSDGPKPNS